MFAVVTVSAVFFAIYGQRMMRAQKERAAVARITALGGTVQYAGRSVLANEGFFSNLIAVLFIEEFGRVTSVDFSRTNVTIGTLEPLEDLRSLQQIALGGADVTGSDLRRFQHEIPNVYVYK